jgi:hypothetical protein
MAWYRPLAVRASCSRAQIAVDYERIFVGRTPALTHDGAIRFLKAKLQRSCERVFNFLRSSLEIWKNANRNLEMPGDISTRQVAG